MSKIIGRVFPVQPAPAPDHGEIEDKALEKMTVTELTAYATAHGINIEGLVKKAEVLTAIHAAQDADASKQPEQ